MMDLKSHNKEYESKHSIHNWIDVPLRRAEQSVCLQIEQTFIISYKK